MSKVSNKLLVMFAVEQLFLWINLLFEKTYKEIYELGSMAFCASIRTYSAFLGVVYVALPRRLVFYTKQPQANFWWYGRGTQAGNV